VLWLQEFRPTETRKEINLKLGRFALAGNGFYGAGSTLVKKMGKSSKRPGAVGGEMVFGSINYSLQKLTKRER